MGARRSSSGQSPPPFDPRRVRPAADEPSLFGPSRARGGPAVLTVSQLTRLVRGAISKALPGEVHVVGQLSNLAEPTGGHLYFTLKDESSEVRCVMWRSSARGQKFRPVDGMAVVATGSVDVYEPRGQYQFYVRRMEPRGVGALELAFRQLRDRLDKEGLFDPARKRRLPRFPRQIAVVTSPTGAAVQDILKTIRRRYPCTVLYVFGVRVQGEGAAEEVADAIRRINHDHKRLGGIDVMIVGRGGGSLEDLWAFNEETVARAIHASAIPVISAVGHEMDFTIADFVADVRAATPTAAAELAVPALGELLMEIDRYGHRLVQGNRRVLEVAQARLSAVQRCEWFRDPIGRVRQRQQQVDEVLSRLQLTVSRALSRWRSAAGGLEVRLARARPEMVLARRRELVAKTEHRLRWAQSRYNLMIERRLQELDTSLAASSPQRFVKQAMVLAEQFSGRLQRAVFRSLRDHERAIGQLETRLAASSHEQVLKRGFTITRQAKSGKIIRKSADVREGDRLLTRTAEGQFESRVVDTRQKDLFE